MSIGTARSRLVSFRMTEEELDSLKVACLMHGARNISDFARSAVVRMAEQRAHSETQLLDRFSAIELRLAALELAMKKHTEMLHALLKSAVNPRPALARGKAGGI